MHILRIAADSGKSGYLLSDYLKCAHLAGRLQSAACMTPQELRERTMVFALEVFKFTRPMLDNRASGHAAMQLFRAATAVAANYRAACLGRSRAEFIAKLGVVREEVDEVVFWIEFSQRQETAAHQVRK